MTDDEHDHDGPPSILGTVSAEVLAQIAAHEHQWRNQRLRQDIDEAKRRLETAIQLLADATAFIDDE